MLLQSPLKKKCKPDDTRITQQQASRYDCPKQHNPRQIGLIGVQKCIQAPSVIETTRTFAFVFVCSKAKRNKAFRCSATIEKTRVFCSQAAQDK